MIALVWFQAILDGLGWLLARLYDFIPNYGVVIIIFTLGIRFLLLPLGIKQIKSMQATAVMQPKIKAIQQKHKGDRTRMNEEMMKLYKEYGYNPLSGCFPLIAQLPVLICLFAVLQFPKGLTHIPDSHLRTAIVQGSNGTHFLGANLTCNAVEAGKQVSLAVKVSGVPPKITLDCGSSPLSRVPYYLLALLMVGTTYYQQRQMQRSSPAGQNPQQQTIMRIMPLLFGVWGFIFPAGLVVYWTTTNLVQIGQQYVLIHRKGAPLAMKSSPGGNSDSGSPRSSKGSAKGGQPSKASKGSSATRKAGRPEPKRSAATPPTRGSFGGRRDGTSRGNSGGKRSAGGSGSAGKPNPNGGTTRRQSGGAAGGSSGARDARDRKKRPER